MDTLPAEHSVKRVIWKNCGEAMVSKDLNGNGSSLIQFEDDLTTRCSSDLKQKSAFPATFSLNMPYLMPLQPVPSIEEHNSGASTVLTGTAKKGGPGPSVGAVDIGVSKSAYFFQVALPGVKQDSGQFSCEIERDGKVHARGVTATGEKTISRHGRVFEMKIQQQCPPGLFTLCFSLPGPVDPRLFIPKFRSDGILEGVVMKYE